MNVFSIRINHIVYNWSANKTLLFHDSFVRVIRRTMHTKIICSIFFLFLCLVVLNQNEPAV